MFKRNGFCSFKHFKIATLLNEITTLCIEEPLVTSNSIIFNLVFIVMPLLELFLASEH